MGFSVVARQNLRVRSSKAFSPAVNNAIDTLEKRVLFAAFTPGDLVIYRVGTGSASLSSASTAVFLDEYSPTGTLVQSIAVPTAVSGSNNPLTATGTGTNEGELSLTQDGQNLLLTGYDTTVGTAGLVSTTSTAVAREIGIVNSSGGINTSTTLGAQMSSGSIYGAAGDGSGNVYASGSKGIFQTSIGSTASATGLTTQNTYDVLVSTNQLDATPASNSLGVVTVGSGLPTTAGQTLSMLNGENFSGSSGAGVGYSREFAFATLNGGAAPDTLYVVDAYNSGIDKLSNTGTAASPNWVFTGEIGSSSTNTGLLSTATGIAVRPVVGGEQLFITTKAALFTITDPYGFNSNGSSAGTSPGGVFSSTPQLTTLATPAANEAFRGLSWVPQADPAWLDARSDATFSKTTETLTVYGPTTIIGNPRASGDQTVAITDNGYPLSINVSSGSEVQIGSLAMTGGASATLNNSSGAILATSGLSIDSTSSLDLGNGFVDITGGSLGTISGYAANGYNNGAWNGTGGIFSSVAAANSTHLTAVGVIQNNQGGSPLFTSSNFDGITPGASDILVAYTYDGDANLSGAVNGLDYSRADSGSLNGLTGWFNGDFNYDLSVNGSDYTLLDNAFNTQGSALPAAELAVRTSSAASTAVEVASTPTTDSFFSSKKIRHSLISELEATTFN